MMLRHARQPVDGQPVENTFFAIDERTGEQLGASVIYVDENPTLYPARPVQVRIHLENPDVPDALLGAPNPSSSAESTPAANPKTTRCFRALRPSASRTTTA